MPDISVSFQLYLEFLDRFLWESTKSNFYVTPSSRNRAGEWRQAGRQADRRTGRWADRHEGASRSFSRLIRKLLLAFASYMFPLSEFRILYQHTARWITISEHSVLHSTPIPTEKTKILLFSNIFALALNIACSLFLLRQYLPYCFPTRRSPRHM